MTPEAIYLASVLLVALVLFYTQWLRTDVTALAVMMSLLVPWRWTDQGLQAILTPAETFHGFGSPALLMVAALFVLSAAMVRTGAAELVGRPILLLGAKTELRFQLTVLIVVTLFSAVINDTTTVLVWMPLVMAVCRERGYAPSRVLMPLAFASLLGGQWTLIGTRSNVILSDYLRDRTGEGLPFFSFTPIAFAVFIACALWFVAVGRRWLRRGETESTLESRYEVAEFLTEAMAAPGSELVGRTIGELDLAQRFDVTVLQVVRAGKFMPPQPWMLIEVDDVLVIQGRVEALADVVTSPGMSVKNELSLASRKLRNPDLRIVEAILPPDSEFEDSSLRELDFHRNYGVSPLAISRRGRTIRERPLSIPLKAGDSMLLVGHEAEIDRLRNNQGLLLLESRSMPPSGRTKAAIVLGLMAAMVLVSATGLASPAVAIPMAALAAILFGCIGMRSAYDAIDMPALIIVGAMIPFGTALQTTGTAQALAQAMAGSFAGGSPHVMLIMLLLLAVALTQLIENAAVAVILCPIAFELAVASGADPRPFLLGVAICVSTAFMTPMAHESTILVMGPGRYRFRDYLVFGTPFAILTWLVTSLVLPLIYPLTAK